MMIEEQVAVVFYSPTRGRRYFVKLAAIRAEARAMIYRKYPVEPFEPDTGHCYDIRLDEPDRFRRLHQRLCRMIRIEGEVAG